MIAEISSQIHLERELAGAIFYFPLAVYAWRSKDRIAFLGWLGWTVLGGLASAVMLFFGTPTAGEALYHGAWAVAVLPAGRLFAGLFRDEFDDRRKARKPRT